jgi:hypothetical protein
VDDPSKLGEDLESRLVVLPTRGEALQTPWAGSYWPTHQDNINFRWSGADSSSASEKFGSAFDITDLDDAISASHGIESASAGKDACTVNSDCDEGACAIRDGEEAGVCMPTWFGICHAWAPVSAMWAEPEEPVTRNKVDFAVNDIKALLTLSHNRVSSDFVSSRCNDDEGDITLDEHGNPTDEACIDTNPGTMHIILANFLGINGESLVEDRTFDDEVWNQPIRSFNVEQMTAVSAQEANTLIGHAATVDTSETDAGTVTAGQWTDAHVLDVSEGGSLEVILTGDNDADLYVNFGSAATDSDWACRPYVSGSAEQCILTIPSGVSAAHVAVKGWATSSAFELSIQYTENSDEYTQNADAVSLYHVRTKVGYIYESPSNLDGHLGDKIDRYTGYDNYEYILELDADGNIIGGEWLNDSRTSHPDFLWSPHSASGTHQLADGAMEYGDIMSLYFESTPNHNTGWTVSTESATLSSNEWAHYGPFTSVEGSIANISLKSDDTVHFLVKTGAQPAEDYSDYEVGYATKNHAAEVAGGSDIYVSVRDNASGGTHTVTVVHQEVAETVTETVDRHLSASGAVGKGEWSGTYIQPVAAGETIHVCTTSEQDVDLYVRFAAAPTASDYDARGYTWSGNESASVTASEDSLLYIKTLGYHDVRSYTVYTAETGCK